MRLYERRNHTVVTDNYVSEGEDNYDTENVYADKFNNENQRADCPRGILENISKIQQTYLFRVSLG